MTFLLNVVFILLIIIPLGYFPRLTFPESDKKYGGTDVRHKNGYVCRPPTRL